MSPATRQLSDATHWTAADLDAALDGCDCIVEATFWGVSVDFMGSVVGAGPQGRYTAYSVAIYPTTDVEGIYGERQPTAEACLADCRSLLRDYAGAEWETWLTAQAIRSGLQPPLFGTAA